MPKQTKKVCKLVNDRFCWVLKVDEQEIPFQGSSNAEYFEAHYKKLGYKIERERVE